VRHKAYQAIQPGNDPYNPSEEEILVDAEAFPLKTGHLLEPKQYIF